MTIEILSFISDHKFGKLNRALRSFSDKHTFAGPYHEVVSRRLINLALKKN